VWRKQCRASRHFLKRPPSIAVDLSDLRAALAAGAHWLEVKDVESGIVWATRLDALQEHGLEVSRGFGPQVALPLASPFWVKRGQSDAAPMLARQLVMGF
jgi:hypothetical protein